MTVADAKWAKRAGFKGARAQVWSYLCRKADEDGFLSISRAHIAAHAAHDPLSERTIQTVIQWLLRGDLLRLVTPGRQHHPPTYRIVRGEVRGEEISPLETASFSPGFSPGFSPERVPTVLKNSIPFQKTRQRDNPDEVLDQLWVTYPRRSDDRSKVRTRMALIPALGKADGKTILAAAAALAALGGEREFNRKLAKWLDEDGWTDDAAPTRPAGRYAFRSERLTPAGPRKFYDGEGNEVAAPE